MSGSPPSVLFLLLMIPPYFFWEGGGGGDMENGVLISNVIYFIRWYCMSAVARSPVVLECKTSTSIYFFIYTHPSLPDAFLSTLCSRHVLCFFVYEIHVVVVSSIVLVLCVSPSIHPSTGGTEGRGLRLLGLPRRAVGDQDSRTFGGHRGGSSRGRYGKHAFFFFF